MSRSEKRRTTALRWTELEEEPAETTTPITLEFDKSNKKISKEETNWRTETSKSRWARSIASDLLTLPLSSVTDGQQINTGQG